MLPLRGRQIVESDIANVVRLFTVGFPNRTHKFWMQAFDRLKARQPPAGLPQYGYLMEKDGAVIGAILLICSKICVDGAITNRCNLSSWYVEPAYGAYAPLLVSQALRHQDVTYLNVSPAPHTLPTIEAQGFRRYCEGTFITCLALTDPFNTMNVKVFGASQSSSVSFDPFERQLLLQHAQYACISLWCTTEQDAYPFVFRPHWLRGFVPGVQLIYCQNISLLTRFAGPIGRYLTLRGYPATMIDSNGPISGLVGVFRRGRMPKYFKGPIPPRLGDLSYTESALFGI